MADRGWDGGSGEDQGSGGASLWRRDEGQVSKEELVVPSTGAAGIWRPDEGTVTHSPTRTPTQTVDLWGEQTRGLSPTAPVLDPETSPNGEPPAPRLDDPGASAQKRRRPLRLLRRVVLAVLFIALVALAVDGALVVTGIRDDLVAVRADLAAARNLVEDGEVLAAGKRVESALASSLHASDLTARPSFVAGSYIPWVEVEASAIDALAEAASEAAAGAAAGLDALTALDVGSEGVAGSFYRGGRVNLDAFVRAEPHLDRAQGHLASARSAIEASPDSRLEPVREALGAAGDQVNDAFDNVSTGGDLMGLLPDLLGGDGPRRYLLAFQALGEARGTGGLIGTYGLLSASDGEMELEDIGPIGELIPTPKVEGPRWFEKAYGPFAALRQPQQVNLTPHFPTAAEVFLRMYEAKTGVLDVDGVLALDPVALGYMLEGIGPIRAKGLDRAVTSGNAAEILMYDSYSSFPETEAQNLYIERLVGQFWVRIKAGQFDRATFARGVGEATRTGHLKVYTRSDRNQAALIALEAADDFTSVGPNVQLVFVNNYGTNKLDFFLEREVDTVIRVTNDGSLAVTTEITLDNETPVDVSTGLLAPSLSKANTMQLGVLLPGNVEQVSWQTDGEGGVPLTYRELGNKVFWDVLRLAVGQQATVRLNYELPASLRDEQSFTLYPQTAVRPPSSSLTVIPPPGYAIRPTGGRELLETLEGVGPLDRKQTVSWRSVAR